MTYSRSRKNQPLVLPWKWIGIILAILIIIVLARMLNGGSSISNDTRPNIIVSPQDAMSNVYIAMSASSKNRITGTGGEPLYVGDASVSVETGGATAINNQIRIDIDEKTELSYVKYENAQGDFNLIKGRVWIEQKNQASFFTMKNASIIVDSGDIAILEQNNQIYSTIYALQGDITLQTSAGEYILTAGNRIMLSASDLANPSLDLATQAGEIDENIRTIPVFIRNNGESILQNTLNPPKNEASNSGAITINSGSITKQIEILEPLDGSLVQTSTVIIRGNINQPNIKRITFDEKEAAISPVNGTFILESFPVTNETNDIVYKVYNEDGAISERGVLTIFASKKVLQESNKLIPNNSPISSKDFSIVSPVGNPYITTERSIRVEGNVPKNTVKYIIVNDYRLQKYISGNSSWYYFANIEAGTLKEGINLFSIKFYGENDTLLYTQLYTIVKESKNATLSGESSR